MPFPSHPPSFPSSESQSYYVAQAGLEIMVLLPQSSKDRVYRSIGLAWPMIPVLIELFSRASLIAQQTVYFRLRSVSLPFYCLCEARVIKADVCRRWTNCQSLSKVLEGWITRQVAPFLINFLS